MHFELLAEEIDLERTAIESTHGSVLTVYSMQAVAEGALRLYILQVCSTLPIVCVGNGDVV